MITAHNTSQWASTICGNAGRYALLLGVIFAECRALDEFSVIGSDLLRVQAQLLQKTLPEYSG